MLLYELRVVVPCSDEPRGTWFRGLIEAVKEARRWAKLGRAVEILKYDTGRVPPKRMVYSLLKLEKQAMEEFLVQRWEFKPDSPRTDESCPGCCAPTPADCVCSKSVNAV